MSDLRKPSTAQFLAAHPVFSLDEATEALAPPGGKKGAAERLKYHVETGRVKRVAREIYAMVPPGTDGARFHPDPFLVASTIRTDAVFSHHSALELLGAAHSTWNQVTVYGRLRRPLRVNGVRLHFLEDPVPFRSDAKRRFGTRKVERRGRLLRTTGPERTLAEGFLRLDLAGGLPELIASAGGFPVLDLDLLQQTLTRYGVRKLWAATGWFLEQFQESFHVPEHYLRGLERSRPRTPRYLLRNQRGGTLVRRWNLIVPDLRGGEPDDR